MRTLNLVRLGVAALVAVATLGGAAADPLEIRMATLAPDGSSWMKILNSGSAEMEAKTNQRVRVKNFAGGAQGDERDIVRKLKLGQLDGAWLTSIGLSTIDDGLRVLELPRMFATVEELDYVADKMWPYFQDKFAKKGFTLQDRGEVGWVSLISKNEVRSIADLKSQKVWLWADDGIAKAMFKKLGLVGVPLTVAEVDAAFTTQRIDAAYGSPLAVIALQWSTKVKFIMAVPMSYAINATVVRSDVLKKISAEDHKLILKITKGMSKVLRNQIRKDNVEAKKYLLRKGVTESETPAAMVADFDKAAQEVWSELVGTSYSKTELELVLKHRADYRARLAK